MSIQAFIIGAVTPDSPIPEMPASLSTRIWVWDAEGRILISVIFTLPRSAAASFPSGASTPDRGSDRAARRKSRRFIGILSVEYRLILILSLYTANQF